MELDMKFLKKCKLFNDVSKFDLLNTNATKSRLIRNQ